MQWINYGGGAEGGIKVVWGPNTAAPGQQIITTHVTPSNPLTVRNGIASGLLSEIFEEVIKRNSHFDPISETDSVGLQLNSSDDNDRILNTSIISEGGLQTNFSFGTLNTNATFIKLSRINLIQVGRWVVTQCNKDFLDYADKIVNIDITGLISCRRSDGTEYELEDNEIYKISSTCEHHPLP